MRDSRKYYIYPSDLNILEATKKFQSYLIGCGFNDDPHAICSNLVYELSVNKDRTLYSKNMIEFIKIFTEHPYALPIFIHSHQINKENNKLTVILRIEMNNFDVTLESNDIHLISSLHEKVKSIFQLKNPLENLPEKANRYNVKKSVFIAHRFDDYGNNESQILSRFLNLLGYDVKEGLGYEAKDIPNKVLERIKTQDIFICLVTPGDFSWVLSEASVSLALNKYLIVLLQDGVKFKKGIIGGDYEHISFPEDNIEKIFIDLLYALPR